jgi:selenocysteine-specific elongation factor
MAKGPAPEGLASVQGRLVPVARLADLEEVAVRAVTAHHAAHADEAGLSLETLRHSLRCPGWLADAVVQAAIRARRLKVAEGIAALPSFKPAQRVDAALLDRLVARVTEAGLTPPSWAELAGEFGQGTDPALREAVRSGRLTAVERDRAWSPEAVARFAELVQEVGGRDGEVSPGALRDRTGASRKFLIPLLEWCDRQRVTIRQGERRVLNPAALRSG